MDRHGKQSHREIVDRHMIRHVVTPETRVESPPLATRADEAYIFTAALVDNPGESYGRVGYGRPVSTLGQMVGRRREECAV